MIVTGGAGFIGSHLVDKLIEEGYECFVIDNLSRGSEKNLNPKATFYKLDIRDKELDDIFSSKKPDVIFHLAAQIDVRSSIEDPKFDLDVNVNGTLNLLSLSVKYKVKKFIFASTGGAIYGDRLNATERTYPKPLSPYGLTKLTSENYIRIYKEWYGLNYTIFRYANVYGPRQSPEGEAGVVAIFITKLLNNEQPIIYGDGKMMRDYVFVKDVVSATVLGINKGDNEIINIGTGKSISNYELYKKITDITGLFKEPIFKPKRKGEATLSGVNISKAKKIISWIPKTSIDDGIKETFIWFKENSRNIGWVKE